jgi:hypothetical protein
VRSSKPESAVLVDEGALVFFSRDSMTKATKQAVRLLTSMRTYNLFLCVCVPSFFILDKYIREHRVRSLSKVYDRGLANFYFTKEIRRIKQNPKTKAYVWPRENFTDSFPKITGPIWDEYVTKKKRLVLEANEKKKRLTPLQESILLLYKNNPNWSQRKIAKHLGCAQGTVWDTLKKYDRPNSSILYNKGLGEKIDENITK